MRVVQSIGRVQIGRKQHGDETTMPVVIAKTDGSIETIKSARPGRPKGSKDKTPRKKPRHNTVQALRKKIIGLERKVNEVTRENDRLARGYESNPLVLVRDSNKPVDPEEIKQIAETPTGEVRPGAPQKHDDELLAVHDRRTRVARLMLRGVPQYQIAQHLSVNVATVAADARAVREQWRSNVTQYSIEEAIGESLDFYREIRNAALIEGTNPVNKTSDCVAAMNTAIKAEDSKNAFLARLGLWQLLDEEKSAAFKGNSRKALEQDGDDFSKVVSFMAAASNTDTVDGDYDDLSPVD
jgi:DNA-binding NarL/FixJ family response regulator